MHARTYPERGVTIMKFIFPCARINDFFAAIPRIYSRQKEHKLSLLKRHGIKACLGTAFLRKATPSEAPAEYVLLLQDPEAETIFIMLKSTVVDNEDVIIFLSIIPEKYSYFS